MKKSMLPLNLGMLNLTQDQLKTIRPVTTLDIFDGPGGNFHDDGLFSTLTFGRVGDPLRDRKFGYIDLKIPVLHPVMYQRIIRLKGLYKEIMMGTRYAIFNQDTKDFEPGDVLNGNTGYEFFISHWHELAPAKTGSTQRDLRIDMLGKYRDKSLVTHWLVLPAGLREADIETDGRVAMDEINDLYQSVLMIARNFPDSLPKGEDRSIYDRTRYSLTLKLSEIYTYIERLITGKKGFIQGRFASRRVFNTTRNVLTSQDVSTADLTLPNRPKFRDTMVGLHQVTKGLLPKAIFYLKQSVLGEIFDTANNTVELVDPTTLKRTWVEVATDEIDLWSTNEGLEKVIHELSVIEKRDRPIMVADHYLALVYVDDKQNYKILRSIDDVPEGFDSKWVRPITWMELIYLSGVDHWNTFPSLVTRYPVENYFSSIPCKIYVKTTITGELRYRLDNQWQREPIDGRALEYPIFTNGIKAQYHDSISVPPAALDRLGADFFLT